jgi:choline-sulfatase
MSARPNLLFLFSDQHTQKIAGCYGDSLVRTPNLDRLAADGVTFDNAYCPSPICLPSRMSMLTARHPFAQECWTNDDFLASDRATWPHAAGAAGYRPALVGRLHAMGPDQMHGYAQRVVGDHSPNWAGIPRHDLGVLGRANDPFRESLKASGAGQSAYQVKDIDAMRSACAKLAEIAAERKQGKNEPFCLSVGFMLPHPPYVAWEEDFALYEKMVGMPELAAPDASREHPWLHWWRTNRGIADVSEAEVRRSRAAYYGLVTRLDLLIGEILRALERTGLADDTLIVYASDHGEQLGERGLWWKHTLYDESVKVPLIMSWPSQLPKGERRAQVVNLIDVSATMVDAMGAPALPNGQGISFLDVARDGRTPWVDRTFSEYCTDAVPDWTGGQAVQQRMIRSGDWKLIYYHGYRPQLFNLRSDPHELDDLAAHPDHRAVREQLLAELLGEWNPHAIADRMAVRRKDKDMIGAWARSVRPPDQHRWNLEPEQNRLDDQAAE